jgi:S1-C subfamily serine protease
MHEEDSMFQRLGLLAGFFTAFIVSGALAKPPDDAPRLDDEKQEVTRKLASGKEEKSKVDLKYYLQVNGAFDDDGFTIESVTEGGPAAMLMAADGSPAMMEAGDVITEIEGKAVKSPKDYAKALNDAKDHTKIKIKLKDVRTGDVVEFSVEVKKHEAKEKKETVPAGF